MPRKIRLHLNAARVMVSRHVNIRLKDGSVIINVHVVEALRGSPSVLCYETPAKNRWRQVPLRDVDWVEPLNTYLLTLA